MSDPFAGAYLLEREQWIARPLDEVFAFFADAANLEAITPPWLNFEILTPLPIAMREGARIDYRIRLFGVPLRWKTRIDLWQPEEQFIDRQLSGPYALWHHTHEFRVEGEGVLMTDRVRYRIGFGPLGHVAHALFVRRWLKQIFDYRREQIERLLGGVPSAA